MDALQREFQSPVLVEEFIDGREVHDKIIAVLNDDRRSDHIKTVDDLGDYFKTETKYFWENIKALKKAGTGVVETFHGPDEAIKVLHECALKYQNEYAPKLEA